MTKAFLVCFCIFGLAADAHAGAMLYMIKQKQMMKERQQQMQQQQYNEYMQGYQPNGQGQPASPAPETYQQQIDERNQAIAQAIQAAHDQAVASPPFGNYTSVDQTQASPSAPATGPISQMTYGGSVSSGSQMVDLSEVWKKLDTKSTIWKALDDDKAKVLTVSEYIQRFSDEGAHISQPPEHYAQMIDQMSGQNPDMLNMPFGQLLQIMAIIEYDFDNGMDKDALAKKVLGESGYEANKKRFEQSQ